MTSYAYYDVIMTDNESLLNQKSNLQLIDMHNVVVGGRKRG